MEYEDPQPVTPPNRFAYNLSGVIWAIIMVSWMYLLLSVKRHSPPIHYFLTALTYLLPGLLYLLTRPRWPLFALFQRQIFLVSLALLPAALIVVVGKALGR